jgi:hypothetical protein
VYLTIYADESKARGFRFALTIVSDRDAGRCRLAMLALRKGPTRRIHFVKEMNSTRKAILATIRALPVAHVVVEVGPLPGGSDPRERGLVALARLAREVGATTVVLERDPTTVEKDRRVLFANSRSRNDHAQIHYYHLTATEEPLLWIPDAIAWSWTRGGEWRRRVMEMGVRVIAA